MNCLYCHSPLPDGVAHCTQCGEPLPEHEAPSGFTYAAFISYRHLSRDAEVAQRVQKAIETYRLPRGIAIEQEDSASNATHLKRPRVGKTLGKCFRDEDELAASPSLPDSIQEALAQSHSLVVICSPETQESAWVRREIEAFVALHGRERIICVLAAGSPEESIPAVLKTRMMPDTNGVMREMPAEPLAADLRPEAKTKRKAELLRIIAAVAGCGYDDLRRRERTRKRKRIALASAVAALAISAIAAFAFQLHQTNEATLVAESKQLAAQSQEQLADGQRIQAIESALAALPSSESDQSRPLVAEAQKALEDALLVHPDPESPWRPLYELTSDATVEQFVVPEDGPLVSLLDSTGCVNVFSLYTGAYYLTIDLNDHLPDAAKFSADDWLLEQPAKGALLVRSNKANLPLLCFDMALGTLLWKHDDFATNSFALSEDERSCAVTSLSEDALICTRLDMHTGEILNQSTVDIPGATPLTRQYASCLTSNNEFLYIGLGERVFQISWKQDNAIASLTPHCLPLISSLEYHANSLLAASCQPEGNEGVPGFHVPYSLIGYSTEHEAWDDKGVCNMNVISPRQQWRALQGIPEVIGVVGEEQPAAAYTVGEELKMYDFATGDMLYSTSFSSAIIAAKILSIENQTLILVATADGSIDAQLPNELQALMGQTFRFATPFFLKDAAFSCQEGHTIVLVQPADRDNQVLAYILDPRKEESRTWSLDELIEYANELMRRREAFAISRSGLHPL